MGAIASTGTAARGSTTHPALAGGCREATPQQSPAQGRRTLHPATAVTFGPFSAWRCWGHSLLTLTLLQALARPRGQDSPTARPLRAGVCLHHPKQAPTPLQHPPGAGRAARPTLCPSTRAARLKAGTCPHPAVTRGSIAWPGRGSLRSPCGPHDHGSATATETKPSGVLLLALPQANTVSWLQIVPSRAGPASPVGMALVAPVPSSVSSGCG